MTPSAPEPPTLDCLANANCVADVCCQCQTCWHHATVVLDVDRYKRKVAS